MIGCLKQRLTRQINDVKRLITLCNNYNAPIALMAHNIQTYQLLRQHRQHITNTIALLESKLEKIFTLFGEALTILQNEQAPLHLHQEFITYWTDQDGPLTIQSSYTTILTLEIRLIELSYYCPIFITQLLQLPPF